MNWPIKVLNGNRTDYRSVNQIKQDIDDEIQFHLDCRIEDLRAEGLSQEQAETAARAAFGSQASIRRECRHINYGGRIWLTRLTTVALLAAAIAIAWLAMELVSARSHNNVLISELKLATAHYSDVSGVVRDVNGQRIADADVLIIVKTWADDTFDQNAFATKTDLNGNFNYPELIPNNERYAVMTTVVAEGHALESVYTKKFNQSYKPFRPLNFKLKSADLIRVQITDEHGQPAENAVVFPASRFSGAGEFLVYLMSAHAIEQRVDSEGWVSLPYFRIGDEAELKYKTREMDDWEAANFFVEKSNQEFFVETSGLKNSF